MIPFGDFDMNLEGKHSGISITFRSIFNAYREAEEMGSESEIDDESQRPVKRVKRVGRTPSPIEQLNPNDEARFRAAETAAQDLNKGSDYEPSEDEPKSDQSSQ